MRSKILDAGTIRGRFHNVPDRLGRDSETSKGVSGEQVMERALSEGRVLITEDRDFGELVCARGER